MKVAVNSSNSAMATAIIVCDHVAMAHGISMLGNLAYFLSYYDLSIIAITHDL